MNIEVYNFDIHALPKWRPIPNTFEEVNNSAEATQWKEAMRAELDSLKEMGTWTLSSMPPGRTPLDNKWVYSIYPLDRCKWRYWKVQGSSGSKGFPTKIRVGLWWDLCLCHASREQQKEKTKELRAVLYAVYHAKSRRDALYIFNRYIETYHIFYMNPVREGDFFTYRYRRYLGHQRDLPLRWLA